MAEPKVTTSSFVSTFLTITLNHIKRPDEQKNRGKRKEKAKITRIKVRRTGTRRRNKNSLPVMSQGLMQTSVHRRKGKWNKCQM
jgi:hypothetical protein